MLPEKDIELIDSYLRNELSESEIADFKYRLEKDNEFAREYEFMCNVAISAKLEGRDLLKKKLGQIAVEYEQEATGKIRFFSTPKFYYSIAASVILILSVSIFMLYQKDSKQDTQFSSEDINNFIESNKYSARNFSIKIKKDSTTFGYAALQDSITISIIPAKAAKLNKHYLFRNDTLYLFGDLAYVQEIRLNEKLMQYELKAVNRKIILPVLPGDSVRMWKE